MPFIAIAAIIALAIGGGVTVAADKAQPGDALYSYKTTVNDNIRSEYREIKAALTAESNTQIESEVKSETQAEVETESTGNASGTYLSGSADLDTAVDVEVR